MVVIGNLEADTVKETVDDVCEKESTEVIMDDFPAHVKVSEAVDKTEARFVKPKEGHKELPWVQRPYPMQKPYSLTCIMESK